MSVLEKVASLLPQMTAAEKAQLLQWVVADLTNVFPGIEKTPGICGGDARLANTRIPVWSLVHSRQMGISDAALLDAYPQLLRAQLQQSWDYYAANKGEIDELILENEAF